MKSQDRIGFRRSSGCLTATALIMLAAGCTERLARENVFANTETLLGIAVTQNPTTQVYEARIGYARHELFYVPTSKFVLYDGDNGGGSEVSDGSHHDPSSTPQVLAEIQVGGDTRDQGAKVDLYQRLAVGELAVGSPAAAALMARDADSLRAASELATITTSIQSESAAQLRSELDDLLTKELSQSITVTVDGADMSFATDETKEFAAYLVDEMFPGKTLSSIRIASEEDLRRFVQALRAKVAQ